MPKNVSIKFGFKNVFVIDIAEQPLLNFKKRFPNFPESHLINDDFFNHNGKYDLIVENCTKIARIKKLIVL